MPARMRPTRKPLTPGDKTPVCTDQHIESAKKEGPVHACTDPEGMIKYSYRCR